MRIIFLRFSVLCAMVATALSPALADTINLDFETGAPCSFSQTTPLTNLGDVTFTGVNGNGGSILNECGNFGQDALSGTDFYAFNTGSGTGSIVDLEFGGLINSFSIWASEGFVDGTTFLAEGFSYVDVLLDSFMFDPIGNEWGLLSLTASNIDRVRLTFTGGCCAIYDDLTYTTTATVPEPGTLALLGIGLAGMGLARRRKKA